MSMEGLMKAGNKITIIGSGYVGMSLAVLMGQKYNVHLLDIDTDKVKKIKNGLSTVKDDLIQEYLNTKSITITATLDSSEAFKDSNFYVVATPTNYNEKTDMFDTSSVESVISEIMHNTESGLIVIKSTIPVGFTQKMRNLYSTDRIIFSPEFLREGSALYDNLYPSRIIVGGDSDESQNFASILKELSLNKNVEVVYMKSEEAEAVKLFSNTYLAMRISFFNELDSFAMKNNMSSINLIKGICLDSRIGDFYNNPSFGYGGYCLPKDTKQLLANYKNVPQNIIQAIVDSNKTRKNFIADQILLKKPKKVGIYQLAMKMGSDNFRSSSIVSIMKILKKRNIQLEIYENLVEEDYFLDIKVEKNFHLFKNSCDLIIANRITDDLQGLEYKVFTRDLFGND